MWGEGWGAVGEGCGDCGWCWALIFYFFMNDGKCWISNG